MMGKLLKFLFGFLLLLVVLVVAAVVVLPLVVDPNDYKPEIAAAVKEQTGRNLEIEGDISLSVFPWLGLDIGPTRLSNAEGFAEPHMARMDTVQVRVKLVPLLSKQLQVDKVKLSGLQLYLGKDKAGRSNWADLQGRQAAAEKDAKAAGAETGTGGAATLESLSIGGIKIVDAKLVWDDRAADSSYEINELSFTTGAIEPGERFDIDLQFKLAAKQPAATGAFSLKGDVLVAPALNAIDIAGVKLVVDAEGDGVPAGRTSVSLASDIAIDLDAQTLNMPDVVLKALGMVVAGTISGTKISADDPQFKGVFTVAEFAPRDLIKELGQDSPVTADSKVLGSANARLEWTASAKDFNANVVELRLDDTTVKGNASVARFDAPAISFALAVDQFDLDRYLPPPAEDGKAAADKPEAAATGELPLETLRSLNLNGKLEIGTLKAFNLRSTNVEMQVKASNGVIRVTPASARLYNGNIQNDITLDVRNSTPRLTLVNDVNNVKAGPLLKDMTGKDQLLGTANLHANINASGATAELIKQSLSGNTSFSFTDGAVKGVNVAALIRNARAKLKGEPAPATTEPNQTDFTEMKGTTVISNGLIRNDDLLMSSPLLRLTGKGEVSLPKETIDYTLTAKLVSSLEGQGGAALDDLKGISIPVHVGGTFSKPSYAPDLGAALSDAAKAKVEEKVEEQKQKIQKKIEDKLQDKLLKGLFK
ncbi:MAG: AsmA family protein [Gammaproteobacteria bacterium]